MNDLKTKLFEYINDMKEKKRAAIEERKKKILAASGVVKTIEVTAKEIAETPAEEE